MESKPSDTYGKIKIWLEVIATIIAIVTVIFGSGIFWHFHDSTGSDPPETGIDGSGTESKDPSNESTSSGQSPIGRPSGDDGYPVDEQPPSNPSPSGSNANQPTEINSDTFTVPNVIGMEETKATDLLLSSGLAEVSVSGMDVGVEHYYILDQSIPSGTSVPAGTSIELTRITKEPGTFVEVPGVIGMEQQEAVTLLIESGLQFQVWWTAENNISSEYHYIINQSIPVGSSVLAGTLVELELSVTKP